MSDLIKFATPLTRGIIWLAKDEADHTNPRYKEIDYLLDGLLTANLNTVPKATSRVIIGKNFDQPLYVFIARDILPNEVTSYISLLDNLSADTDILVVDEVDGLAKIKSHLSELTSHLRIIE
jgi:hypothetical protein